MRDPGEGVATDGTIVTGVSRRRVAAVFEPVLAAVVDEVLARADAPETVTVMLYGSVATGQARPGLSDVDVLAVGPDLGGAPTDLSARFAHLCRGVEVARAAPSDLVGDGDEAYGHRLFVRHYCVRLAGPDLAAALPAFPADVRAARALNGDIGAWLPRWRTLLDAGSDPGALGRRVARKTLLAVAGLVSVHDGTWTTDRVTAARRWGVVSPRVAGGLRTLESWSEEPRTPGAGEVRGALDGVVAEVAATFGTRIGMWDREPAPPPGEPGLVMP